MMQWKSLVTLTFRYPEGFSLNIQFKYSDKSKDRLICLNERLELIQCCCYLRQKKFVWGGWRQMHLHLQTEENKGTYTPQSMAAFIIYQSELFPSYSHTSYDADPSSLILRFRVCVYVCVFWVQGYRISGIILSFKSWWVTLTWCLLIHDIFTMFKFSFFYLTF